MCMFVKSILSPVHRLTAGLLSLAQRLEAGETAIVALSKMPSNLKAVFKVSVFNFAEQLQL